MKLRYKLIIFLLLLLLLIYIIWVLIFNSPSIALEYLKVFISWPVVMIIFGFLLCTKFRKEMAEFLKEICSIKFPGGTEIKTKQSSTPSKELETNKITLTKTEQGITEKYIKQLEQSIIKKDEETGDIISTVRGILIEEQRKSLFWFFSYCNFFFAPMTKDVLKNFSISVFPIKKDTYHVIWNSMIKDENQREIILQVLLQNRMLVQKDGIISISDTGKAFLSFIGY
ncbi:hypothetical protein ACFL2G_03910 [Candidatus Omnitrophota bacterium]